MRRWVVLVPAAVTALALGMPPEVPAARAEAVPVPLEAARTVGTREPPPGWPGPPAVSAPSYLLVDADTGQALAMKDADLRRSVASTVKVLTALSVLRRASFDDLVTVGEEVRGLPPDAAKVGLQPGQVWTVGDLLEGLIARSGNDTALALAAGVGGSVEGFVGLMSADAATIGLHGLALYEPAGLGDRNRLSARDLVEITRAAMADPRFVDLVTRRVVELPVVGSISSRNRLLREYPGALGVKTGYTGGAGRCLVAAAERDGRRLVAVVLGSTLPEGHFSDARTLLDFGFGSFTRVPVAGEGPELELRVPGGWVTLDAPTTSFFTPASGPALDLEVALPVEVGPELATDIEVRWRGTELGRLQLSGGRPSQGATSGGTTAVGDWLMGRTYAAMRAATAANLWAGEGTALPVHSRPPGGFAAFPVHSRPPGGFAAFPAVGP